MDYIIFASIGTLAGVVAGLCGIGGGVVIIPLLMLFAGFSQQSAIGTSLAVLLPPIGIAATIVYYRGGHVNFKAAVVIAVFLLLFSWISSLFAQKLPVNALKLVFGILIILVGAYYVFTAVRST